MRVRARSWHAYMCIHSLRPDVSVHRSDSSPRGIVRSERKVRQLNGGCALYLLPVTHPQSGSLMSYL